MESDSANGKSDDDSYNTDAEEVEWEHTESHLSQEVLQAQIAGLGTALEEAEVDEIQREAGTGADVAGLPEDKPRHVVERALAANRRLQSRLVDILAAVDRAILRNAETQAKLMHNAEAWPRVGRYRGMRETTNAVWGTADTRVVGPSRFWVADRRVPEPNADALKTAPAFQYLPHFFRDSSWTQQEQERLQRAILQAVYKARSGRMLLAPQQGDPGTSQGGVELALDSPGVEAEVDAFGTEEWEEIARLGSSGRSGHECSMQWAHRLRPSLNLGPWSAEEDAKLVKLQLQYGMHSWEDVARELGTGRTAAACLAQYQRCHNATLLQSKWTPDDAARLASIVTRLGTNWTAVAAEMGNRTAQQVQHYYRDNMQARKKGAWSCEEDAALLKAVETCGRRWREVAKRVPARSDKQCRERFCNVLDPNLKREDEWTPDEDAALRAAIAQHTQPDGKIRWAKVGGQLAGRTDNACWRRSKTLAAMERGTRRPLIATRGSGGRFMPANTARSGTPVGRPAAPSSAEAATGGESPAEPDSAADRSADRCTVGDGEGGGSEPAVGRSTTVEPLSRQGQGAASGAGSAEIAADQCGGEPGTEPASTTRGATDESTGPCQVFGGDARGSEQAAGGSAATEPGERKSSRGRSRGVRKTAQSSAASAGEQHAAAELAGRKRERGRSAGASRTAQSSAPSIGQQDAADAGMGAAPNPEEHAETHGADCVRAEAGAKRKKPRKRSIT
ncbi:probable snRNA-activating protein complex subunit 4 [Coccomyxa sp. Obi]|nr:probable snRNA-activating protein complex subunit 4 [Coccomyxa sp. Obi]